MSYAMYACLVSSAIYVYFRGEDYVYDVFIYIYAKYVYFHWWIYFNKHVDTTVFNPVLSQKTDGGQIYLNLQNVY